MDEVIESFEELKDALEKEEVAPEEVVSESVVEEIQEPEKTTTSAVEIQYVYMTRNHKISGNSNWLEKDHIYHVSYIEGGVDSIIKMVRGGCAKALFCQNETAIVDVE